MRIMINPEEDTNIPPLLLHIIQKTPEHPTPAPFEKLKDFVASARKYRLADALEESASYWIRVLVGKGDSCVIVLGFESWLFIADNFPGVDCSSRMIEKLSLAPTNGL